MTKIKADAMGDLARLVHPALEQIGIVRVDDCHELYEAALLLRRRQRVAGRRAAATSISGGNLVMVTDLGAAQGLVWPRYAEATQQTIATLLPGRSCRW